MGNKPKVEQKAPEHNEIKPENKEVDNKDNKVGGGDFDDDMDTPLPPGWVQPP